MQAVNVPTLKNKAITSRVLNSATRNAVEHFNEDPNDALQYVLLTVEHDDELSKQTMKANLAAELAGNFLEAVLLAGDSHIKVATHAHVVARDIFVKFFGAYMRCHCEGITKTQVMEALRGIDGLKTWAAYVEPRKIQRDSLDKQFAEVLVLLSQVVPRDEFIAHYQPPNPKAVTVSRTGGDGEYVIDMSQTAIRLDPAALDAEFFK